MVTWKLALAVIIIAILLMLAGMWVGYRYVRQQDDITPAARGENPRTLGLTAIAEQTRPNWDTNVRIGLIPNQRAL